MDIPPLWWQLQDGLRQRAEIRRGEKRARDRGMTCICKECMVIVWTLDATANCLLVTCYGNKGGN